MSNRRKAPPCKLRSPGSPAADSAHLPVAAAVSIASSSSSSAMLTQQAPAHHHRHLPNGSPHIKKARLCVATESDRPASSSPSSVPSPAATSSKSSVSSASAADASGPRSTSSHQSDNSDFTNTATATTGSTPAAAIPDILVPTKGGQGVVVLIDAATLRHALGTASPQLPGQLSVLDDVIRQLGLLKTQLRAQAFAQAAHAVRNASRSPPSSAHHDSDASTGDGPDPDKATDEDGRSEPDGLNLTTTTTSASTGLSQTSPASDKSGSTAVTTASAKEEAWAPAATAFTPVHPAPLHRLPKEESPAKEVSSTSDEDLKPPHALNTALPVRLSLFLTRPPALCNRFTPTA